jgi:mRNA interferase HigB
MRVIAKSALKAFWEKHPDAQGPLQAWYDHVQRADWKLPRDVQQDYGADAVLQNNRAVFNLKGNRYRLVVQINYHAGIIFIRFIGAHADYNRINALTI